MPEKKTKAPTSTKEAEAKSTIKEEIKKDAKDLEKKAEKFEKKADETVNELVNKVEFADKITKASRVDEILNLSFINSANKRVRKNLELICKILWRIALVIWVIYTVISLVAFIVGFVALFKGGLLAFLIALLALVCSAISVLLWRWLIKMKKRVPAALIILIALDLILLILSIFNPGQFGSSLVKIILYVIFTLFALKNKDMFKN